MNESIALVVIRGIAARMVIRLMAWSYSLFTNRMTMPYNVTGFETDQPVTMPFLRGRFYNSIFHSYGAIWY